MEASQLHPTKTQWRLLVAIAACYGLGYPIALIAHSNLGWLLVTLGGGFLIALGVVTVRRIHHSMADDSSQPTSADAPAAESPPD